MQYKDERNMNVSAMNRLKVFFLILEIVRPNMIRDSF
jgi:hypothetical protein